MGDLPPLPPPPASETLLDRQRVRALRASSYFWLAIVPVLIVLLVFERIGGRPPWPLALALVAAIGVALAQRRAESAPKRAALATLVGVGAIGLVALVQYGPVLGAGMLWLGWVLAAVFFFEHVLLPTAAMVVLVLAVGLAKHAGYLTTSWPMPPGGLSSWIRITFTTAVMGGSSALAFRHLMAAVAAALSREAQARADEAAARAREAELESERHRALRAAAARQHLEALGRLAGGVAHDFNNALTVVRVGIESLRDDRLEGDERAEVLDDMHRATTGAQSTAQQMLSFVRQGTVLGEPAQVHASLRALSRSLTRLLPETIHIETELEEVPAVTISSGDLEQAVLNLCINARDAMPDGGTLTLRCRHEKIAGVVSVDVVDSGAGMDRATLMRAFEPFYTTKEAQGTGLGLSMVHGVVARVGGNVRIDSEPDRGTTVTLLLPLLRPAGEDATPTALTAAAPSAVAALDVSPPAEPSSATGASPAQAAALASSSSEPRTHRVLLLEDDALVRRSFSRVLRRGGYEVVEAESVAEAMKCFERDADFDAMIADAVLPDGSPGAAIERYRESGHEAIVVCSGYVGDDELITALRAEQYAFLAKPVAPQTLLDAVKQAIDDDAGTRGAHAEVHA